jgi:hypothetical protein
MSKVEPIIEAFGGTTAMARILGKRYPARVSDWKRRGSIPASEWKQIVEAAERQNIKGVTLDRLASIHDERAA